MRTTVTVNDELVARAAQLTGRTEASVLFRLGLEALVERESARRLVALGGSDPQAVVDARDRFDRR
jgi:Arc/MetJ family transcription regulator